MKKLVALLIVALAFATAPAFSADLQKGLDAFEKGDYKTALREWLPFAEDGHSVAQNALGVIYRKGEGVSQDYKKALHWYKLSAGQGHVGSQNDLGLMHYKGWGVLQDYKTAARWWRLSAEHGYVKAQYNLGLMYDKGHGVLQDYVRAHMWYNIAALNGHEKALENRDGIAKIMSPAQLEKAQESARNCEAKNYKNC